MKINFRTGVGLARLWPLVGTGVLRRQLYTRVPIVRTTSALPERGEQGLFRAENKATDIHPPVQIQKQRIQADATVNLERAACSN